MSQEFNSTQIRILGALSKLDDFFLNSQVRVQSGTAPESSRNHGRETHEYNEDRSQNGLHPEMCTPINWLPHSVNLSPDQVHHNNNIQTSIFFQSKFLARENCQRRFLIFNPYNADYLDGCGIHFPDNGLSVFCIREISVLAALTYFRAWKFLCFLYWLGCFRFHPIA